METKLCFVGSIFFLLLTNMANLKLKFQLDNIDGLKKDIDVFIYNCIYIEVY